ncbi:MAG: tetratricopeptide repeat protein [Acidobacteriota bacterium]
MVINMQRKSLFRILTGLTFSIAILGAMAVYAPAQSKKDIREAKKASDQGDRAFNQGNYRVAIENYNKAIALVPTEPYSHFWKGLAHHRLNEDDQALAEFDLAMKNGHRKPLDIYMSRWRVLFARDQFDQAAADINDGLKLDPENRDLTIGLGDVSFARRDFPTALTAYQKAVLLVPNSADIYYRIAQTQKELGNIDGQRTAAEEAINKRTQYLSESQLLVAEAYQRTAKYDQALDFYQKAITAKPDNYAAYRNMADIYRSQGNFSEAIEISKKGQRLFPNDSYFYSDLSWFYSLSNRKQDAVDAALAAIRLSAENAIAYRNLCRAYNDLGNASEAVKACNNALSRKADDGETLYYLGNAYTLAGRKGDATRAFSRAVASLQAQTAKSPNDADSFYLLGNSLVADGQAGKAADAYNRCLELSPRFARAKYNLAIAFSSLNQKDAALEQYRGLIAIDPELATKLKAELGLP